MKTTLAWLLIAAITATNLVLYVVRIQQHEAAEVADYAWQDRRDQLKNRISEVQLTVGELQRSLASSPPSIELQDDDSIALFRLPQKSRHILSLDALTSRGQVSDDLVGMLHISQNERQSIQDAVDTTLVALKEKEASLFTTSEDGRILIPPFPEDGESLGYAFERSVLSVLGEDRGRVFFDISKKFFIDFGLHQTSLSFVHDDSGHVQFHVQHSSSNGKGVGSVGGSIGTVTSLTDPDALHQRYPRYGHLFAIVLQENEE